MKVNMLPAMITSFRALPPPRTAKTAIPPESRLLLEFATPLKYAWWLES